MAEKIGVYFDKSSLEPYLDLESLSEKIQNKWSSVCPVVRIVDQLASEQGHSTVKQDIDAGEIDAVSICGTSPRKDQEFFDFGQGVSMDRVNLRELCIWAYRNPDGSLPGDKDQPLDLQGMAQDYINMSMNKLQRSEVPEPEVLESVKKVLVLGGGWSGINAALSTAGAGYEVILVEKQKQLGGHAAQMYKTFPLKPPYTQAQEINLQERIEAVNQHPKITVYTGSTLQSLEGQPGNFTANIQVGSEQQQESVGAAVIATGWEEQDTSYLEPMGYGKHKNVITTWQLEQMAQKGEIVRPSDGAKPQSVAFVLGFSHVLEDFARQEEEEKARLEEERKKREEEEEDEAIEEPFQKTESYRHLPYTTELTTMTALKQARYIRENDESALSYIIYEHMTASGLNEHYYKAAQDDPGIMLTKGMISSLEESPQDRLVLGVEDNLIGEPVELEADLLVLPTGLVPTTALDPVVQLAYRQGKAFPELELFDGFADSNYICFPYETRRTGIYTAGCVHQPMSLAKSERDAQGAALKAIQCLESVNRGVSVHPRSGDLTYPKFNFVRCTQCRRCTIECPFGALEEDADGTPKPNIARCRRCGTCMGCCPERVIYFDNYSVGQIGAMISSIDVPEEMEEGGPRILILACENDAYPALDMAAQQGKKWSPYVRIIPVRCLGSVNTIWIADAMSKGNDGCLLLGCKYGEDYQCHFMKGSELCQSRMQNIGETLDKLGIETERVRQEEAAIDDYERIPQIIDNFVDEIFKLGPNPFKGF
ncbi:MAG: hydrogenase iron-sulfur subunit [Desulfohalobiaceae bacterium]|nr:hydrogenase iron-sulfur subunit [Desulfohalobiaceae bacterium]